MIFIGDVHGKIDEYLSLRSSYPNTIQLGDLGFNYNKIPHDLNHVWIMGNHDNWSVTHPCMLRDFGPYKLNGFEFFYIAGAYSIDKKYRTVGIDWFCEEETPYERLLECIDYFASLKPRVVVSHTCPLSAVFKLHGDCRFSSRTEHALEQMFSIHQPEYWIFGHHHKKFKKTINGTRFICLSELGLIEIDIPL